MPSKIAPQVKQLALEKLRKGMNAREVAELTGVSRRTIERWQSAPAKTTTLPARNARQTTPSTTTPTTGSAAPVPPTPGNDANSQEGAVLDFQDSPAPVGEKKSLIDAGMDKLRGILGIGPAKQEDEQPKVPAVALTPQQQKFVANWSPILSLGLIVIAGWAWSRIGPEYRGLAPDDKTALRIIEPLMRIYARHAPMLPEANPDVADAGAALFALWGYLQVSLSLYQQIKQEQEEANAIDGSNHNHNGHRAYRSQDGAGNTGGGQSAVFGASNGHVEAPGLHDGYEQPIGSGTLTAKEQSQHAALSRLAELDYLSRARRSGQFR